MIIYSLQPVLSAKTTPINVNVRVNQSLGQEKKYSEDCNKLQLDRDTDLFCVVLDSVLLGAKTDPSLNIDDPISDHFFHNVWNKIGKSNAVIYEKVFRCLPLDSVRNLRELMEHVNAENISFADPEKARQELQAIKGILVHFPLHFLSEEYLLPPLKSKERMVPMEVWT